MSRPISRSITGQCPPTLALLVVLAAVLSGCQSHRPPELLLLDAASWPVSFQATQTITLTHGAQTSQLTAALALSAGKLVLVGLSPLGQRLFTLSYGQDQPLTPLPAMAELGISPTHILGLVQLALWPEAQLLAVYGGHWHLQTSRTTRALSFEQRPVITLTRQNWRSDWPYEVQIEDHLRGISLAIVTLEYQRL